MLIDRTYMEELDFIIITYLKNIRLLHLRFYVFETFIYISKLITIVVHSTLHSQCIIYLK